MKNRLLYNLEILKIIVEYTLAHPELRFNQILWALNIIDRSVDGTIMDKFYEEPDLTLIRLKERINDEGFKTSEKD